MTQRTSSKMSNIWNKAKKVTRSTLSIVKKVILFLISKIIPSIALLGLIVVPFLHGVLPDLWAYIAWGVCSAIFIADSIVSWYTQKKKTTQNRFIFTRGASVCIFVLFAALFVANYFDTAFTWPLAIAVFAAVVNPISLTNLQLYFTTKNQYTAEQIKKSKQSCAKSILFYWLIIGFFVSLHLNSLIWQFISGGLSMLIIYSNLSAIVLSNRKFSRFGAVQDLLIGVALTVYLIYIIPNKPLQDIIVVIIGALYGGLMTLLGVAWTIKDGQQKGQESKRLEKIPYLKVSIGKWLVGKKQENGMPDFWLNLTPSNNENCVSSGFSLELTNIGLGLADNLECNWLSGEISSSQNITCTLLECKQVFFANAIVDAKKVEEITLQDASLVFAFDDLLGNHYTQTLNISFLIQLGGIKPISYKMSAPIYIGRSQEVKNA